MARTDPFDAYPDQYDTWFDLHRFAFDSEVEAIRSMLPARGEFIEVGVGTGRFAAALGIPTGVEPSAHMRWRAAARGIRSVNATAEALPFDDGRFDAVLLSTVICFLNDSAGAFREAHRVLKPAGCLIVAFLDRDCVLGREYELLKESNPFMKAATFTSASEVERLLRDTGFRGVQIVQTLFSDPATMTRVDPVRPGSGEGSFVVIRGEKVA